MALKRLLVIPAILTAGFVCLQGCEEEEHHHHGPPPPRVVEVAPYGYAYGPEYYDQGYYHDNYWYWEDHGRRYREAREDHDRRMHEYREHGHYDHDRR